MRILLDTHILIWALTEPSKLSRAVRTLLETPESDVAFSAASIWEIAVKSQLPRGDFPLSADGILAGAIDAGFVEMPVSSAAAAHVAKLPLHHRDPFDRLLVAQAITTPAYLYTADRRLQEYSGLVTRI
jgi:PIN domain nuclease of toxin-antitoxin system